MKIVDGKLLTYLITCDLKLPFLLIPRSRVDVGAELIMPTKSTLIGTRTWIAGMLVGVEDLKIGNGGDVVFLTTAQTALIENLVKVISISVNQFQLVEQVS